MFVLVPTAMKHFSEYITQVHKYAFVQNYGTLSLTHTVMLTLVHSSTNNSPSKDHHDTT